MRLNRMRRLVKDRQLTRPFVVVNPGEETRDENDDPVSTPNRTPSCGWWAPASGSEDLGEDNETIGELVLLAEPSAPLTGRSQVEIPSGPSKGTWNVIGDPEPVEDYRDACDGHLMTRAVLERVH